MGVPLGGSGFSSVFCLAADPILTKSPNASVNDGDATTAPGLEGVGEDAEKEGMGVKPPLLITGEMPPPAGVLDGDAMLLLLRMYTGGGGGGCGAPFVLGGGGGGVASAKGLPADAVVVIIDGCIGEGAGAVA